MIISLQLWMLSHSLPPSQGFKMIDYSVFSLISLGCSVLRLTVDSILDGSPPMSVFCITLLKSGLVALCVPWNGIIRGPLFACHVCPVLSCLYHIFFVYFLPWWDTSSSTFLERVGVRGKFFKILCYEDVIFLCSFLGIELKVKNLFLFKCWRQLLSCFLLSCTVHEVTKISRALNHLILHSSYLL